MPDFDVIVVGAGHAGIEASLASARLGSNTLCLTLNVNSVGHLPCNCSIGGPAKGHMAREVDALGGQMGFTADYAATHIRRVATGKGPSVRTIRAHVCKDLYPRLMKQTLESQPNLTLRQASVATLETEGRLIVGVILDDGSTISARAVVLTTGTFLGSICHTGKTQTKASRFGEPTTYGITDWLKSVGIRLKRFKTGTTPRIRLESIDLSRCAMMEPELDCGAFSYLHDRVLAQRPLLPCYQTRTNAGTHELIQAHLHESAMYSGAISGIGPRYCPSIEDKVVKFAEKNSHPVFLELETWDGQDVYVQGFSSSLPADTQLAALKTIEGLGEVEMIRAGYAVEYDVADPTQLTPHLMSQAVEGLFLAGQLNGTSGYEEAAGQGIVAGINAHQFAKELEPIDFPRSNSFIGVMVDDLVTKGVDDPYRMLTARAEHRLYLRSDNADARLTPLAAQIGLATEERIKKFEEKQDLIAKGKLELDRVQVHRGNSAILAGQGEVPVGDKISLLELMRRPSMTLEKAEAIAIGLGVKLALSEDEAVREQISLAALYQGYLVIQERQVKSSAALDAVKIPMGMDYDAIPSLSFESKEKLNRQRPQSLGQALRIPGVRVTDVLLLLGKINGARPNQSENSDESRLREPAL